MDELKWIRQGLLDKRPKIVAEKTGLSINTVIGIAKGRNTNPTISTLAKLDAYLRGEK